MNFGSAVDLDCGAGVQRQTGWSGPRVVVGLWGSGPGLGWIATAVGMTWARRRFRRGSGCGQGAQPVQDVVQQVVVAGGGPQGEGAGVARTSSAKSSPAPEHYPHQDDPGPRPDDTTHPGVEPAPSRRDSRATLDPTRPHKINITDQDHRNGLLAESGLRKLGWCVACDEWDLSNF